MPSIAAALASQLLSTSSITDIIDDRVFPLFTDLDDQIYPQIVYKVAGYAPTQTYDGPTTLTRCTATIDCIGSTYAEADGLFLAVLAALDGSGGTWGGVSVLDCSLVDDSLGDDVVTSIQSEQVELFIKTSDWQIWFINA